MKKKISIIFALVLVLCVGLSFNGKSVSAAKYGAKQYTAPKTMRGTWKLKKSKALIKGSSVSKTPYRKIKINKHTITFYRKTKNYGLKGTYKLYKPTYNTRWSIKEINTIEKYAIKHKWLAVDDVKSKSFVFKYNFLRSYEEDATGELKLTSKKSLTLTNAVLKDTFKK